MAKIITAPHPLLLQKAQAVKLGPATSELVKQLKTTLQAKEGVRGVGLSAPQIGISQRVFVAYSSASRQLLTFINPEINWLAQRLSTGLPGKNRYEGCLSVPNVWGIVNRPTSVKVRYQTERGTLQVRKFSGLTAAIVQHEYDHLEGILFTQRVLEQHGRLYTLRQDDRGQEQFEEIRL